MLAGLFVCSLTSRLGRTEVVCAHGCVRVQLEGYGLHLRAACV